MSVCTRSHRGKKEKKEETKNRPRFAPPTLLKRKKRRFDHTFEPRWRQPEWPGRHGFTGEKVHFNSLLSFLPEIRVIVICSWNEKIVEQSGTRAAGILCVKGKGKKSSCVEKPMRVEKLLTLLLFHQLHATLLYPPLCRDSTSLNFCSRETCFGGRFNFELTRTSRHDVSKPSRLCKCPLSQRTDFPAKWITSTRFSPLCVSLTPYRVTRE